MTEPRLPWLRRGRALVLARGSDALLRFGLFLAAARAFAPEALRYAAPTAVSDAIVSLHRRVDVFLLSVFGRTSEIGPYALAYAFGEAFWVVTDSFEWAFASTRPATTPRAAVRRALPFYAAAGLGGLVLGYAGGRLVLSLLFERRYPVAIGLLPWPLAAAVAWGIARPFASFFLSQGRVTTAVRCQLVGAVLERALLRSLDSRLPRARSGCRVPRSYAAEAFLFAAVFWNKRAQTSVAGPRRSLRDRAAENF